MTQRPRRLQLRSSRPVSSELSLAPKGQLSTTGQCAHPTRIIPHEGRIGPEKRACVPLAGQLMALNKPTIAGHQRPLPPQSNSLTAFHRTVVSRRVPVAGAKGPFETTSHSVWSTTFIRSSFIRPPCTSILERAVSISRRSAGVS